MRLLVVSHACVTPINQSFFHDVSELLGWDLSIVSPQTWRTEYGERRLERWPGLRGELIPVPVWKSGNIPLHVYKNPFISLLRRLSPDAIYVHHEPYAVATAQVYAANRLSGAVPIGFYAAQNILKKYPPPFRWLESFVLKHAHFSFPVTEGALQVLRAKGYTGNAEVLPLAVDRTIYFPRREEAEALRRRLGVLPGQFLLGYVGRLVEEKGLLTLVEALASIQELPWHCVLVGSGPQEESLRLRIATLGLSSRFSFTGYVEHAMTPVWLSSLDVLVLPSETRSQWKEQFGRVLVEANACGTPVVGTRSGEIPEVVNRTGGGLLVKEKDPHGLAQEIKSLIEDPMLRQRLATQGLNAVTDFYDQRSLATRFAQEIARAHRTASPL